MISQQEVITPSDSAYARDDQNYLQHTSVKDTMLDLYQWRKAIGIEYDKVNKNCSFWYNVDLSVFDKHTCSTKKKKLT